MIIAELATGAWWVPAVAIVVGGFFVAWVTTQ